MNALNLTGLSPLMQRTCGIPEVVIGLIDGPVATAHPELNPENLRTIPEGASCNDTDDAACRHGTFIAGILKAKRSSRAPALCPGCTLLIRPVFFEQPARGTDEVPGATPVELASAIFECIQEGARVLNLSVALEEPSPEGDRKLKDALDFAAQKAVLVVAAAGNQGIISGSALTRHPWVLPVAACDLRGRPAAYSNIANSIRRNGLRGPGEKITSLGSNGQSAKFCGTSTAVPFVTGAIALLWSVLPRSTARDIKTALTDTSRRSPCSFAPPLLNAWEAYHSMRQNDLRGLKKRQRKKAA